MRVNVILAHCRGYGIGCAGKMCWHNGADMRRFARLTTGRGDYKNAIVMGRKTWQSLPHYKRPLAFRDNLIVSRQCPDTNASEPPHSLWFSSIDAVLAHCETKNYDEVWIIGGEQLYSEFLGAQSPYRSLVHTVHITCIDAEFQCDTFCSADTVSPEALCKHFALLSVRTEMERCTSLVDHPGGGDPETTVAGSVNVTCYEYANKPTTTKLYPRPNEILENVDDRE